MNDIYPHCHSALLVCSVWHRLRGPERPRAIKLSSEARGMNRSEGRQDVEGDSAGTCVPPIVFLLDPHNHSILKGERRSWKGILLTHKSVAFLALSLLCCVYAFGQGIAQSLAYRQLSESGAITQGEITSRQRDAMTGRTFAAKYFVTFRYRPLEQNITFTNEQMVDKTTFDRLVEGTRVEVHYVTANPTIATLVGLEQAAAFNSAAYFLAIFGLLGLLLTTIFLVPGLVALWKVETLMRRGRLLPGQVLACRRYITAASTSLNPRVYGSALQGKFFIELSYRFRAPTGQEIRATMRRERNDLRTSRLPGFGTPVKVLYLDDKRYAVL